MYEVTMEMGECLPTVKITKQTQYHMSAAILGGVLLKGFSVTGNESTDLLVSLEAIESLILAHACAGVDITSCFYVEGVKTTVETLYNRLDCESEDAIDHE